MKPNPASTNKLMIEAVGDADTTKDGLLFQMDERAASILGFSSHPTLQIPRGVAVKLKATHVPDYRRSIYSIYIYCNLCEHMNVGDKRVPLLRNVAFNSGGSFGATISIIYTNPLYVRLNTRSIHSIDVELRDDMGELIPFIEGKTTITLHFRRQ